MPTPLSLGGEIATFLAAQGLGLTPATNLFVAVLPDQPDLCVGVFEYGGTAPTMTLTGQGAPESKLDNPYFQVRTRASMGGYVTGNTLANNIYSKLQGICEQTLNAGGALFHLIVAQQSPVFIGQGDASKQRPEWTQNFRVIWENDQR